MPLKPDFEWQLEDYLRVLRLHKWFIGIAPILAGGFTTLIMLQQPNLYKATARVLIEAQVPKVVQFQEVNPLGAASLQGFLQTEYRVIGSRAVMSRVVEKLHLAAFPPFSLGKDPVSVLQGLVSVEPVRSTKLVDISATGNNPELVARIADSVADTYAQVNLDRRQGFTTGGIEWLRQEVAKMEQKMQAAQLTLQTFLEQHGTVDLGEEQQNTILQRLQALSAALTETRKDRIEAETKYRQMHPELLELQAKERELQLALYDQQQQALEQNRLSIQYDTLFREVKTNEAVYNSLLTRLKELSVQEGLQANNVQVVDYALLPDLPIGPQRMRVVFTFTLLGLLLSGGLAFLREILVRTIRTRREFELLLGIPFLGHLPIIKVGRESRGEEYLSFLEHPHSPTAEAIRAIRTTLEFLLASGKSHTLLVTSALPEEGKSILALTLAVALQELGRKVLLIDADMRRSSIHRLTKLPLEPGLSGFLEGKAGLEAGHAGLEELVQVATEARNLPVITAGMTPPQPTDLLAGPKMRQLLEALKSQYQYILIDTPPILSVADTTVLAGLVDGTLFTVWAGRTHRDVSMAGKQRLVDVGVKIIGGILNRARLELERGYRYYYYHRERAGRRSSR